MVVCNRFFLGRSLEGISPIGVLERRYSRDGEGISVSIGCEIRKLLNGMMKICCEEALLQLVRVMSQLTWHLSGNRDDSPTHLDTFGSEIFDRRVAWLLVFGFETRRKTNIT